jgi:NADH dehydrogenase [ubiquinone] 1 alpha subcomplex assembly factor 3
MLTRLVCRPLHPTRLPRLNPVRYTRPSSTFTNILASEIPPPVQVESVTHAGITLSDGLVIPGACIFLEGKIFLWDVPNSLWDGWGKEMFQIFEVVVPKPGEPLCMQQLEDILHIDTFLRVEILLFGTGKSVARLPSHLHSYVNQLGIQVDVMDTVRCFASLTYLTYGRVM